MKTYSVAIQNKKGIWFTNWHQYAKLEDIDFSEVEEFCKKGQYKAYGYYYGVNSSKLTSSRCRVVIKELSNV